MTENQDNFSKGSVSNALAGNIDFDVKAVLQEGWKITQTNKLAILQGMGITVLVALMVMAFAYEYSRQKGIDFNEPDFRMGMEIVMMILVAPFAAGLLMMGVHASIGGKVQGSHIFQFTHRTFSILVASLLTSAVVQIGMLFLILPGLYLFVATGFTIPLMLDKGIPPASALVISVKAVNKQWLKFVQLHLILFVLFMTVVATFGLTIIWVVPFYYNVKGLLYRAVFGVGAEGVGEQDRVFYSKTKDASGTDMSANSSAPKTIDAQQDNVGKLKTTEKDGYFDA